MRPGSADWWEITGPDPFPANPFLPDWLQWIAAAPRPDPNPWVRLWDNDFRLLWNLTPGEITPELTAREWVEWHRWRNRPRWPTPWWHRYPAGMHVLWMLRGEQRAALAEQARGRIMFPDGTIGGHHGNRLRRLPHSADNPPGPAPRRHGPPVPHRRRSQSRGTKNAGR